MAEHMAERDRRAKVPRATVDPTPAGRVAAPQDEAPRERRATGRVTASAAAVQEAVPSEPGQDESSTVEGASFRHAREGLRAWLHETFPGHENAVVWGFVGFLVALLFFIIGFWRTLLVILLVAVGVAFGQVLDGDPRIINTLRGLFRGDDGR